MCSACSCAPEARERKRSSSPAGVRLALDSPALRAMQAAGVKLAVPLVSQGELIGAVKTTEEVREFLGADTLGYLSLEGLLACEKDGRQFCHACFSGQYPIPVDPTTSKLEIERLHTVESGERR